LRIQLREKQISTIIILLAIGGSVLILYFRSWHGRGPIISPTITPADNFGILERARTGTLIAEFPAELIADPKADILDSVEAGSSSQSAPSYVTFYETDLSLADIKQFYETYFKNNGWDDVGINKLAGGQLDIVVLQKSSGQQVSITAVSRAGNIKNLVKIDFRRAKM